MGFRWGRSHDERGTVYVHRIDTLHCVSRDREVEKPVARHRTEPVYCGLLWQRQQSHVIYPAPRLPRR